MSKVIEAILIGDNLLTLGMLAKTAKGYALNPSVSNEAFLAALLEPYVVAGHVKRRNNLEFELDKHRTSEIVNGKCDVPTDLRKAIARFGLEEAVANNFEMFFEESMDVSLFDIFAEEVIDFLDEGSEADRTLREQLSKLSDNPCAWMAHALMAAIKSDNRDVAERELWHCGTGSLYVRIGDLFANCFGKECKRKRIVVIPVNTTFDTKITWAYENNPKPLVSDRTLHGRWLMRIEDAGVEKDELDKQIAESLQAQNAVPVAFHGQGTSANPEYPLGTIAVVPGTRALFYLLAISAFDENNNAQSAEAQIAASLEKLIGYYDRCGQGLDIFLPLMGTGMSRASLSHQESYDLITSTLTKNKNRIHGRVTVVVYKNDADKLTIGRKAKP